MIPSVYRIRQRHKQPEITPADVPAAVRAAWLDSPLAATIKPGHRIAVGCGSRGIRHHGVIARATVDALKELGAQPTVIAAMGSHGGATRDGQRALLASYGITPENLGCPLLSDMDAVEIGRNSWGEPCYFDKNAMSFDGVVTVSRVKPHTDFRAPIESGIVKMLVIGFGKRDGADLHHSYGTRGLAEMIPETAKVLIQNTPFLGGLAILENAAEETARLEVVPADALFSREPELLVEARQLLGRLPFTAIDALVVGECGKNYSGAGIDPNVVGRMLIEASPEAETNDPRIVRLACLDVSPESCGNGTGIGIADLTTKRAIAAIDPGPFRMNNLTARFLWRSKLPLSFDTDREVITSAVETCWQPRLDRVRLCLMPNTLEVGELWVSRPLADELAGRDGMGVDDDAMELPFDAAGNLDQTRLFPHSVRGRRGA